MFQFKGNLRTDPSAMMRDDDFWARHRADTLSHSESRLDEFIKKLEQIKGFGAVLFVAKAFIENFVETTTDPHKPSKVDIGPVNTTITSNFVDGLRLRASAQTTANLNPHWFGKGYIAHVEIPDAVRSAFAFLQARCPGLVREANPLYAS